MLFHEALQQIKYQEEREKKRNKSVSWKSKGPSNNQTRASVYCAAGGAGKCKCFTAICSEAAPAVMRSSGLAAQLIDHHAR